MNKDELIVLENIKILVEECYKRYEDEIKPLKQERDEARMLFCEAEVSRHYILAHAGHCGPKDVAQSRGWDCFKEDGN